MIYAFITICFIAMAIIALCMLRKKNRLIWAELFRLREQTASLRHEIVDVRKQLVLSSIEHGLRLPSSMPSQYGEDLLLYNFFARKTIGFYVDVGAFDGFVSSNTYFFEALGWTGRLVEPDPSSYQACIAARPYSTVINVAAGDGNEQGEILFSVACGVAGIGNLSFYGSDSKQLERIRRGGGDVREIMVPFRSLNELLTDHQGPIDFVSIDVEGNELSVLKGFDLNKFRPRVLLIEDLSDGADMEVRDMLFKYGYEQRHRCGNNVFYTRSEDTGIFRW